MSTTEVSILPFTVLKQAVQRQFSKLIEQPVYRANVDPDLLWNLYLSSFPEGTNPLFRQRTEHDCSCCRSFIKHIGNLVTISDGELKTIWDIEVGGQYQPVVDALATFVRSHPIENIFIQNSNVCLHDKNYENYGNSVLTWEHFYVNVPAQFVKAGAQVGPILSEAKSLHDVMFRALEEITLDSIEVVKDLISQNSLYRGAEKKNLIDEFFNLKKAYLEIPEHEKDFFVWHQVQTNAWVCRIRNDVIGTLLVDLSGGADLELAVKIFEDKVSGTNYKRPTALVTPKMRDAAKEKLIELDLYNALERRYAKLEDISINNVLFANRNTKARLTGDVFDSITTTTSPSKSFDKLQEVTIDKFISDILPSAQSLEVFVENKHSSNFVSLIAPQDSTAKSLFKWDNPFSWSYNGDVADSIKERVKKAGGSVTGDICCRLAWFNLDDLDLHMREPHGGEIYYGKKTSTNGGCLDVDMNVVNPVKDPVENIFYKDLSTMKDGTYTLFVDQFRSRNSNDVGFEVEIDIKGTLHHLVYPKALKDGKTIDVASFKKRGNSIEFTPHIESNDVQKEIWNIKTQSFHPVTALMLSPNFWDDKEIGNKHFFFMLEGCTNDGSARGFYNEFLNSELEPHRKTMELVGSKMRTENSEDQMSGLGFSSTQRNYVICRVSGSFQRIFKITF